MNLHEVVRRLIGPIQAIGDSTADDVRAINLQTHIDLVDHLLQDLVDASRTRGRHEASMKHSGEKAHAYLSETALWLEEATDE